MVEGYIFRQTDSQTDRQFDRQTDTETVLRFGGGRAEFDQMDVWKFGIRDLEM